VAAEESVGLADAVLEPAAGEANRVILDRGIDREHLRIERAAEAI
jgi:hypothetical protein